VTPDQAAALFALLRAAYPRTPIGDDTADLWLDQLAKLDHPIGETAVRSVIETTKTWPSLAHLLEQVSVARAQADRERRSAERRDADRAFDEIEQPPLRTIPAAVKLRKRFAGLPPEVELAPEGDCDDGCGRSGQRYQLGRLRLCADCARRRLRAAAKAAAPPGEHEAA
jgi:hypothetical protein